MPALEEERGGVHARHDGLQELAPPPAVGRDQQRRQCAARLRRGRLHVTPNKQADAA